MKLILIKCPNCGWEYLPEEVVHPSSLYQNRKAIYRNEEGVIIFPKEEHLDNEDTYICDNCNCEFKVKSIVKYETQLLNKQDEDDSFTSVQI